MRQRSSAARVFIVVPRQVFRDHKLGGWGGVIFRPRKRALSCYTVVSKNFNFSTISCRGKSMAMHAIKPGRRFEGAGISPCRHYCSGVFFPSILHLASSSFIPPSNFLPDTFCSQPRSFPSLTESVSHSSGVRLKCILQLPGPPA